MIFIDSPSTNPYYNLALEEHIFENMPKDQDYFMLWRNDNTIVVGKYQNTVEEINQEYVKEKEIKVVRRLSGGGAVYHDLGNLNFTFIVDQDSVEDLNFKVFTQPVIKALEKIGVKAEFKSRNDLSIDGKKFSGNAQYNKKGRTMHHGTLLFDSNLSMIQPALAAKQGEIVSKAAKSNPSPVTNISDYLENKISIDEFKQVLIKYMFEGDNISEHILTQEDKDTAQKLMEEKYSTWDWNYGYSPAYNQRKQKKFSSGTISVLMDVSKGQIDGISLYGDFFGNGDITDISNKLVGVKLLKEDMEKALEGIDVDYYISGLSKDEFIDIVLG